MSNTDIKLARLLETFADIDISFLESLIEQHPNATLQELITQCQQHQNINTNKKNETICEISSEAISMECDSFHIQTLDNIQYEFHYLFDQFLSTPYIFKLIDVFNHLTIMRLEYKYNNQNTQQLNVCIKTVYNFMNNIHTHPHNEKYRRIRESNKKFQKKVAQIKGSKLLLKLCGWIYIDTAINSIYLFESSINPQFTETMVHFMKQYMQHPKIMILPNTAPKINNANTIIGNLNIGNNDKKASSNQNKETIDQEISENKTDDMELEYKPMSEAERMRQHRLKHFGDTSRLNTKVSRSKCKIGPKLAVDYKHKNKNKNEEKTSSNLPAKQSEQFRKSKHFNMNDILRWRKIDFDREAAGPAVKSQMDQIGVKCLQFTNEFRVKMGLNPLKWHQALCDIGKEHSANMGEKKVAFGHDGFHKRVDKYPFHCMRAAENVAMNHGTDKGVARTAVDGWIKSPGHRKNLLGESFTHCGIGVYQNFDGSMYLTQMFACTHYKVDGSEQVEEDESYMSMFHKLTQDRFKTQ